MEVISVNIEITEFVIYKDQSTDYKIICFNYKAHGKGVVHIKTKTLITFLLKFLIEGTIIHLRTRACKPTAGLPHQRQR